MTKPLSRLLVVDDDESILSIAKIALKKLEATDIRFASSGQQAIEEASAFLPDLIVMDVMMPEMDGVATLKAMRCNAAIAQIPVVFLTARAEKEAVASFIEQGAADVIFKPFKLSELADTISNSWSNFQKGASA